MDLTAQTDVKAVSSLRRKHMGRMREVKRGIRRLEKLMNAVSNLQTALKLMIGGEIANVREVVLVLGASPIRPLHVYRLCFSHGKVAVSVRGEVDFAKTRAADGLSRKVPFLFFIFWWNCYISYCWDINSWKVSKVRP